MFMRRIEVSDFRNLSRQRIELAAGINYFWGANGHGKTNFLEAVHLLATLRSFRTSSLRDVISLDGDKASVSGELERDSVPIELGLQIDKKGRRLSLGGRNVPTVDGYLGKLKVVTFTPDDLSMIKGSPAVRRQFMDRSAFLFDASHLEHVKKFNAALKSRNRLLREKTANNEAELEVFGQLMAEHGVRVSGARADLVERIRGGAKKIFSDLGSQESGIEIYFKPGWKRKGDSGTEQLKDQIMHRTGADIRTGKTSIGPQYDDMEIRLEDSPAKRFASQGQQRSCAVSLLLAVVEQYISFEGEKPLILLDDVSSELDGDHRGRLFSKLTEIGAQVLVTSTEEKPLAGMEGRIQKKFVVSEGKITQQD